MTCASSLTLATMLGGDHLPCLLDGMSEEESLQDQFLRFDRLLPEVKGAGNRMEEADVICHVITESSTAIEVVSDQLTMDLVRRSLTLKQIGVTT